MSKKSFGEKLATAIISFFLLLAGSITLYPFLYIISMSISNPKEVIAMHVWLLPKGLDLHSYLFLLKSDDLWISYYNTLWYAAVGITVNVIITVAFAYPLSRKDFFLRSSIMIFMVLPVFLGGSVSMIPTFILIMKLGLYNTRWAIIASSAMSPMLAIMSRVFFQSTIPDSLIESAKIDGASDVKVLSRIVAPLSLPIISVIMIYNIVIFWNVYTPALLYVPNYKLQPLQVYLQSVLIKNSPDQVALNAAAVSPEARSDIAYQLKYCTIMITILPIIFIYPFLQKYFVKGSMIGAIKE